MAIQIRENIPLAPLTTFKIGGIARYFAEARTEDEIREALAWARERSARVVILGGGSNVLIADEGLGALVMRIVQNDFNINGPTLNADAGCNMLAVMRDTAMKGFGGWEKLAGIPGSIGGAVRGNAGAFGTEIKDLTISVRALNAKTGEVRKFTNSECMFGYRRSFFKDNPEWIILNVNIELKETAPSDSTRLIKETIDERERRHLQNVCAAGSFFMNPVASRAVCDRFEKEKGVESREGRVPAGWLIEKAGMKGAEIGGAIASLQHPNYIVNTGNATAKDVLELAKEIKDKVREQFGIELQEEAAVLF